MEIEEILDGLHQSYTAWKAAEKEKDKNRKQFFKWATTELSQAPLAERVVSVQAANETNAMTLAGKLHPRWKVIEVLGEADAFWEVLIEEDPEYLPFTHTYGGYVFQRQVSSGSLMLDDERLKEENPKLYEAVTHIPQERVLRPLEELDPSTLTQLSGYIYEGKPKAKLAPPREVKDEDDDT